MDFSKKFNIGLTLDTSLGDFESFLQDYSQYIRSIYFSPPISKYFHTRSIVANEFLLPGKKHQFWKMLELVSKYDVELELLFNTLRLDNKLISKAKDVLDNHGINVNSVCYIKDYHKAVEEFFPYTNKILSFNNGFQKKSDIDNAIANFNVDTFVLGSLFIRNNDFFKYLKDRKKGVYLLLNNACSFNCGTCNNVRSVCDSAFKKNLEKNSAEYLYALQSIFPFELVDGTIDTTNIDCFKISNRSSNIKFIRNALDSYIGGEIRKYVNSDKNNYALWGRAGFFWKYFKTFDLDRILEYKTQILSNLKSNNIITEV